MTERTILAGSTTRLTLTECAILGLLGQLRRPISGYDLRKLAESSVGYIWQPSKTQLYVVLGRLVTAGLAIRREVAQHDRPDKHLYRITGAGRAAVRAWLDSEDEILDPDRNALVLKLFFGAQGERGALVRQLSAFRNAYADRLATYEAKFHSPSREGDISDEFTRLTLRYGIVRARAAVDWATTALEELTA
jgi:PadR family transcriptional regulator AphA